MREYFLLNNCNLTPRSTPYIRPHHAPISPFVFYPSTALPSEKAFHSYIQRRTVSSVRFRINGLFGRLRYRRTFNGIFIRLISVVCGERYEAPFNTNKFSLKGFFNNYHCSPNMVNKFSPTCFLWEEIIAGVADK